ncbi:MAG: DNA primase [Salibacteraceae bacterium]
MIPRHKIDEILQVARIEEVIGEFVHLKKAGSNYKGLSPWTDEKTPSFMVSPAKGIFKDFSSGKGGNVVTFLMEHEHFTYPEALRWLAERYNIELDEEKPTEQEAEARNERESLYVINEFARKWFIDQLWDSEEGQNIGLSYLKERGFNESIIKKFQLGYSPDRFDAFTNAAMEAGYSKSYLLATGLVKEKNGKLYDGYKGRIIFPIHNLSGRAIGFGGRTMRSEKNIPKYINSPENDVYDKSRSLYGLYFAKSAIAKNDNCYLVEGYTDVLAFHQKHIENTVASSGTALTPDQVKLIARYSQNITLVFDGDRAGIKASLRGIDIVLEQGMNVKVVMLPEGEDPDSFSKSNDRTAVREYLEENARDFIAFKADLLMSEAAGDPIKTNEVVHAMVDSIALIPDSILRSIYVTECSRLMRVDEQALISELNKALRRQYRERNRHRFRDEEEEVPIIESKFTQVDRPVEDTVEYQERDLLRIMINYHDRTIEDTIDGETEEFNVLEFILDELENDGLEFETPLFKQLFDEIASRYDEHGFDLNYYVQHEDQKIQSLVIDLMTFPYSLNNWERKDIIVDTEEKKLKRAVFESIHAFKSKRVERMIKTLQEKIPKTSDEEEVKELLKQQLRLEQIKKEINNRLGRTILH